MTAQTNPSNGHTYKGSDGLWYNFRDPACYKAWAEAYAAMRGTVAVVEDTEDLRTAKQQGTTAPVDTEAKARLAEALAYVAGYTGTWGLPLDIKANPAFGTKWMRLSDRQVEALLAGKARDEARLDAARLATELYAADAYAAHVARQAQAPAAPAPKAWRPAARVEQDGMYLAPDGTVYKVQQAKVGGSGQLYAKRLVVEDGTGTFVYAPGGINRLDASMRMTLEQAVEYGRLYGVCVRCGSPLTDEVSIAAGIGPVCAGRGW
jgi:hypothetical protein